MNNIGFLVRSLNEERWIGHCLQSILNFENSNNINVKIVVVDNESSDDTLKIVKMFKDRVDVVNILRNKYTPGLALNMGMQRLKEVHNVDFVCIMSAHCVIDEFDVNNISSYLADKSVFGVIGRQKPVFKGKLVESLYVWENFCDKPIYNLKENLKGIDRYFFHNAFSIIKVNDWKVKKFDEDISGKEDRVYAKDQIDLGKNFVYCPKISCFHHWVGKCATWSGIG
jgi:rhamnosyltransferase